MKKEQTHTNAKIKHFSFYCDYLKNLQDNRFELDIFNSIQEVIIFRLFNLIKSDNFVLSQYINYCRHCLIKTTALLVNIS